MGNLDTLFEELDNRNAHVQRKSYGEGPLEYIIFTRGFKTRECSELEEIMMSYGFYALKQDFDRRSGNTVTFYKQQGA